MWAGQRRGVAMQNDVILGDDVMMLVYLVRYFSHPHPVPPRARFPVAVLSIVLTRRRECAHALLPCRIQPPWLQRKLMALLFRLFFFRSFMLITKGQ